MADIGERGKTDWAAFWISFVVGGMVGGALGFFIWIGSVTGRQTLRANIWDIIPENVRLIVASPPMGVVIIGGLALLAGLALALYRNRIGRFGTTR